MLTALVTSSAPTVLAAQPGGGWGGPGWLFFLIPLFWFTLILVLFGIMGRRWRSAARGGYGPHSWSPAGSAEQTLSERFARGDIDETEYRARLEVLRANRAER